LDGFFFASLNHGFVILSDNFRTRLPYGVWGKASVIYEMLFKLTDFI